MAEIPNTSVRVTAKTAFEIPDSVARLFEAGTEILAKLAQPEIEQRFAEEMAAAWMAVTRPMFAVSAEGEPEGAAAPDAEGAAWVPDRLDALKGHVDALKSLLDDPQMGLSVWRSMLVKRMDAVCSFWNDLADARQTAASDS